MVEGTLILSAAEMQAKNVVFSDILFIAIFAEITENECVAEIDAKLRCISVILLTDRQSVVSVELLFYTA